MTTTVYPLAIDGYATLPVVVDLVSPVRAADVNRLRNAIVAVEKELGINPSGTYATVRARLDALELGVGGGGGGGSAGTGEDFISGMIETPVEKEYFLTTEIPYDGYIYSITTQSSAGSCTLIAKINGSPVTATPNSVSTTEETQFTTGANAFSAGDSLSVEVLSNSSCADLTFTVLMFVTPGGAFGEANTGANVGVSGVGPFKQKVGLTLQFRNINAGSNKISVALDSVNNEIDIDAIESNFTLDNIGGVLGISKGGTGQSTANAAFNALAPTTTKGDLIVRDATVNTRVPVGVDGYLLIADSTQAAGVRWGSASFVGANTALSNLAATSINQSLIPDSDNIIDLGTSLLRWRDLYLGPTSLRLVTTAGETGTARNWRMRIRETAGSSQGSLVFQEGASEYLYITPTGNVGIGTTDPSTVLDINGVTNYRGVGAPPAVAPAGQGRIYYDSASNRLRFSENGGAYVDFGTGGGGGGANTALSNLTSTNINTSLIPAFDDGYDLGTSAQRWRDLYLGPTSMHLVSTVAETGTARDWRLAIAEAVGATRGRLRFMEGSSEYATITADGSVGIGTTAPASYFHLRRDANDVFTAITIENQNISAGSQTRIDIGPGATSGPNGYMSTIYFNDTQLGAWSAAGTGGLQIQASHASGSIFFNSGGTSQRLILKNTGEAVFNDPGNDYDIRIEGDNDSNLFVTDASVDRVGIGTSTPASKLHVYGSMWAQRSVDTNAVGLAFINSTTTLDDSLWDILLRSSVDSDPNAFTIANYPGGVSTRRITILTGGTIIFNDTAADADFRVEGTTDANLLFSDASTDGIGIGTNAPSSKLDLNGAITIRGISAPAVAPAGTGRIYFDSTSNMFKMSENTGAYVPLGSGGGGGANTALSNLTSTSINTSLIPGVDDGYDLGTSLLRWRDLYLGPTSLHVVSNTSETGTARDWAIAIAEAAGTTQGRLRIMEGASEYLNITPAGLIGLGTTEPIYDIHVIKAASTTIQLENSTTTGYASVVSQNDTGSYIQLFAAASAQTGTWFANDTTPLNRANTVGFRTGGSESALVFAAQGNVPLQIGQDDTTRLLFDSTRATLNPSNKNYDFQVRGVSENNVLFVDSLAGFIGIGTNGPSSKLDLDGAFTVRGMVTPAVSPAGQGRIYFDSTANDFRVSVNGNAYTAFGGANSSLSNLTTTSINEDLLPDVTDTRNIGSSSLTWKDGYFDHLNVIGYLEVAEVSTPDNPDSGFGRIYAKSDNRLYYKNDLGIEYDLTQTGGGGGANQQLSNLTTTMVNTSLNPGINDGYDIGTDGYRWHDGYFANMLHVGTSLTDEGRLFYNTTVNKFFIGTDGYNHITLTPDGYVGIGTSSPTFNLEVNGTFGATTKSFIIPHPTKPGMKLRYGSLEGPENGVYVRGKLDHQSVIKLPDYWTELIDKSTITVNLTPIGTHQKLYVESIDDNCIYINTDSIFTPILCYYTVFAERKDVDKLIVEI